MTPPGHRPGRPALAGAWAEAPPAKPDAPGKRGRRIAQDALLSIGTLGDLPAALRETTEAVRALVEELAAARAERDRLAEELRQERARPWWRRWWPGKP